MLGYVGLLSVLTVTKWLHPPSPRDNSNPKFNSTTGTINGARSLSKGNSPKLWFTFGEDLHMLSSGGLLREIEIKDR